MDKAVAPERWTTLALKVAAMYVKLANWKEAEPLYAEILCLRESGFGKDAPETAEAMHSFASLLQDTSSLGEAEPLMRRMVGIFVSFTENTGHPHPQLTDGINNYRFFLTKMGKTKKQAEKKINLITEPIAHLLKADTNFDFR